MCPDKDFVDQDHLMEASVTLEVPARATEPVQGDVGTRAQAAAAVAAKHASSVDVAARFPAESFEAIKVQRLLGIMVPRALGGEDASISDVADVCYQLGQSCASTGMIYAMHQIKTACLVRHMRGSAAVQRIVRRLCAEQLQIGRAHV